MDFNDIHPLKVKMHDCYVRVYFDRTTYTLPIIIYMPLARHGSKINKLIRKSIVYSRNDNSISKSFSMWCNEPEVLSIEN
jgi:hypothetical protein